MTEKEIPGKFKNQSKILLKSRFLRNLSLFERYEFLQLCHRRKYKEGEYTYYQNDPGTGMYFIEEGRVELSVVNNIDDPEKGSATHELESPESFGAMSIGYELRRMSSAKCITDCTLLGFFKPDFETLKKRHPEIAIKFIETISMIAMMQLERTMRKLCEAADTKTAFSIQFESYYRLHEDEEI